MKLGIASFKNIPGIYLCVHIFLCVCLYPHAQKLWLKLCKSAKFAILLRRVIVTTTELKTCSNFRILDWILFPILLEANITLKFLRGSVLLSS